jgi:hypothetical protein
MKKLITLLILASFVAPVFAQETTQEVLNENTYLGVNFEKAPTEPTGKQLITNHKSFLIINIVVNGKVKPKADTEK